MTPACPGFASGQLGDIRCNPPRPVSLGSFAAERRPGFSIVLAGPALLAGPAPLPV
jgi:hypothetical protein